MKKILIRMTVIFAVIAAVFASAMGLSGKDKIEEITQEMFTVANEIQHGDESARARYNELKEHLKSVAGGNDSHLPALWMAIGICAVFALYLYWAILRPFHKLEKFSRDVASGNYDKPLNMPRHNVFGAFSWAFDLMREGLHAAQKAEQEAKEANKTLIAALSHDILTPISSIRACAEGLSMGQGSNEERRKRYLETIIRKSDEVSQLTNDLFFHAISDMDKLVIEPSALSLRSFVSGFAASMEVTASMGIAVAAEVPDVRVIADEKRLEEIFSNIVRNAEKYAPGAPVELSFVWEKTGAQEETQEERMLYCVFSDKGTSLLPEDVPFIFYKFYRGKNAADEEGSGLGLYIVHYITEKMGGKVYAQRTEDGLQIFVGLKVSPDS
jgi:signal transduction histidine kinase